MHHALERLQAAAKWFCRQVMASGKSVLFLVLVMIAGLLASAASSVFARLLGLRISDWRSVIVWFGTFVPEMMLVGRMLYLPRLK